MSHLGIHISADVTKCVETKRTKDRGSIIDATDYVNPSELVSEGDITDFVALTNLFREIKKRFKKTSVILTVPSKSSISTVIRLPDMPETEMKSAIEFELEKYIKRGLPSDYVWDYTPINESVVDSDRQKVKQIIVLVSAMQKAYVVEVLDAAKKAGLIVESVESEEVALWRSFNTLSHLNYTGVHIGEHETDVMAVHRGNLYYMRPKTSVSLSDISPVGEDGLSVVVDRNESYEALVDEVQRIITYYLDRLKVPVNTLLLSGMGNISPTVLSNMEIDLGMRPTLWSLPKDILVEGNRITSDVDDDVIDHTYAVSFGLALRSFSQTKLNLIPKEYVKKNRLALVKRVALGTAALLIVSVGSFTLYVMMLENKQESLLQTQTELVTKIDQGTQLSAQISVLQNEINGVSSDPSDALPSASLGDVLQHIEKNIPKDVKIHNMKYGAAYNTDNITISAVAETNHSVGVFLLRLKRAEGVSDAKITKIIEYTYEGKTYLAFETFVSLNGGGTLK